MDKLPDLLMPCPKCNGTGEVYSQVWKDWESRNIRKDPDDREPRPRAPEMDTCPDCEGTGEIPTEAGLQVMKFMQWTMRAVTGRGTRY